MWPAAIPLFWQPWLCPHLTSLLSIGYVVCFPLDTCPSPVLWAYASATITEFNDAHCSGDFPISSTECTCFQHNNCGHGDISAITLLILSLSGYNPVNILWYTAPVDMMTFRWSHRSYQSICQQHPPYSHPQVTLIYYKSNPCNLLKRRINDCNVARWLRYLFSCDFFLWRYQKAQVSDSRQQTIVKLKYVVCYEIAEIRKAMTK